MTTPTPTGSAPDLPADWEMKMMGSSPQEAIPSAQTVKPAGLWCVVASKGEYSGRDEWPIAVFSTESDAQTHVDALDAEERLKLAAVPIDRLWSYDETTYYVGEVEDRTARQATGEPR